MKKILLISAAVLCLSGAGYGQSTPKYCDLIVHSIGFNYVAELHIDSNNVKEQTPMRDANGKKLKFASEVDALNYVVKQGWDLVTIYRDNSRTHFVLTRRKKE